MAKIPTWNDYLQFDGEHCRSKWRAIDDNWECPACGRTKFEILAWTKKIWYPGIGPDPRKPYMGWKAVLHVHHDHMADGVGSPPPRFTEVLICGHCNGVDAAVKRKFDNVMNPKFSFSPAEIRQFIVAKPHSGHMIIFSKALEIYESAMRDL